MDETTLPKIPAQAPAMQSRKRGREEVSALDERPANRRRVGEPEAEFDEVSPDELKAMVAATERVEAEAAEERRNPSVLVKVKPGMYVSKALYLRQAGGADPAAAWAKAVETRDVLVRAPNKQAYLTPRGLKYGHGQRYEALMRRAELPVSLSERKAGAAVPKVMVQSGEVFFDMDQLAWLHSQAVRDKPVMSVINADRILVQNLTSTGGYSGSFTRVTAYGGDGRHVNVSVEQLKLLRHPEGADFGAAVKASLQEETTGRGDAAASAARAEVRDRAVPTAAGRAG